MELKKLVEKLNDLKEKKKAFNTAIDAEIEKLEEEVNNITSSLGDFYENDDLTVVKTTVPKKKIILSEVIKDDIAKEKLILALEEKKVTGSVSIKFEKEILGLPNYIKFMDIVPEEKVKITLKEEE